MVALVGQPKWVSDKPLSMERGKQKLHCYEKQNETSPAGERDVGEFGHMLHGPGAEKRPQHAADAEAAVEHGHDRAFQRPFNGDAVSIHGNIHAADECAEKVTHDDEGHERWRGDRSGKGKTEESACDQGDAGTSIAVDHGAGQRHGGYGTSGDGEQRQAKNAGAYIKAFLGQGNVRHP